MNKDSEYVQQMLAHYQQWEQSNLSQAEYAQSHNLKNDTFKYWVRKFKKEQNPSKGFVAIETIIPSEINIRYPNGVELAIPSYTSMKIIKELIQFGGLCSQ